MAQTIPLAVVDDILEMAFATATPLERMRVAAVNKHTRALLTTADRKHAIVAKMTEAFHRSSCKKASVKLLSGVAIAYTLTFNKDNVILYGNFVPTQPQKRVQCNRKKVSNEMRVLLTDIVDRPLYTKARVNSKDQNTDTALLKALFDAAKR